MNMKTVIAMLLVFYASTAIVYAQSSQELGLMKEAREKISSKTDEQAQLAASDTIAGILRLIEQARAYSSEGTYAKAYDTYWEALFIAHQMQECSYIPSINNGLGVLYSVFEMDEEAEEYFNASLQYVKGRAEKTKHDMGMLRNTYYILASHHRENGNNGIAQLYIDSCNMVLEHSPSTVSRLLADSEQAYIYLNQRKYSQARDVLKEVEPLVIEHIPSYCVVLYSMMGEVYYHLDDYQKSEHYLLSSLKVFEQNNTHQNYIPDVYQKLSNLYLKVGRLKEANRYLQTSKDKTEELFGVRSRKNRDLLEVKDAFRLELERQERTLEEARLRELEQYKQISRLRNLVLTVLFISLLFISFVIYFNLQKQRKIEHESFVQKQRLSSEKNAEVLDFKNKELTSSALQIIQKDELILEIKEQLMNLKGIDKRSLNRILNQIKVNKNHDWTEFEARFSSVNKDFYHTLNTIHPGLTQKDQKLCALLKLKFSSKEISQLLGISAESVITARYRLRKKMNLSKEEDLLEHIINI